MERLRACLYVSLLAGAVVVAMVTVGQAQPRVYDLKTAVDLALANNPRLTTAELRAEAAKIGIAVAGAAHRPTLDNVLTAERVLAGDRNQTLGDGSTVNNTVPATQVYSGALNLNVPLVREGRLVWVTLPSEQAAAAHYDAIKSEALLTRADVAGTVSVTFYAALGAGEEVKVAKEFVELNRVLLNNAKLRFAQQLIPQSEVTQAESGLVAAEAALAAARSNLTRGLSNFLTSIGADASPEAVEQTELVDRDEEPALVGSLADLIRQANSVHPSILAREANIKQAEMIFRVLQTERYPRLDFSTKLQGADTNASQSDLNNSNNNNGVSSNDKHTDFWSLRVMLHMNWRIWDFGTLSLKLKQQEKTIQAEKSSLIQTKNQVTKGVVDSYQTLSSAQSRLLAAEKALDLAEELARVSRERYKQNLIAYSVLLEAEARLAAARKALIQSQYEVRIDEALLRIAMGLEKL